MVDRMTLTHVVGVQISHPQCVYNDGYTSNFICEQRQDTDTYRNLRSLWGGSLGMLKQSGKDRAYKLNQTDG